MKPLPGWVYLLVGAVIAAVSAYAYDRSKNQAMYYFFVIGCIFLIVGITKIVWNYFKSRNSKDDLAAINMQDSINRVSGISQDSKSRRNVTADISEIDMPLDPSQSRALNRIATAQAEQLARQNMGQASGTSGQPEAPGHQHMGVPHQEQQFGTASNMFPYKGIHYQTEKRTEKTAAKQAKPTADKKKI